MVPHLLPTGHASRLVLPRGTRNTLSTGALREIWVARRAVRNLELSHREHDPYLARAVVSGSRSTPYFVGLDTDDHPGDPMLFSSCTCPVASQCKVMALKARKAELFAKVLDGDGMMTAAFGADDIRGLLD